MEEAADKGKDALDMASLTGLTSHLLSNGSLVELVGGVLKNLN